MKEELDGLLELARVADVSTPPSPTPSKRPHKRRRHPGGAADQPQEPMYK